MISRELRLSKTQPGVEEPVPVLLPADAPTSLAGWGVWVRPVSRLGEAAPPGEA